MRYTVIADDRYKIAAYSTLREAVTEAKQCVSPNIEVWLEMDRNAVAATIKRYMR